MDFLISLADHFTGLFQAAADQFVSFITNLIPLVAVMILTVNALIQFIGKDRVQRFMRKLTKYTILRYTVLPFLACFFFANPMCYTFGTFLEEEYKPGFYDATVSMLHPITGLFPHANASELFVWLGISSGYESLGNTSELALRFLMSGFVVILMRGIVTEKLAIFFKKRQKA
ncbi:PTS sorbitol transporter subunit IIC [Streptococcus chenjunshii]|uniref:PTS sorbitol transporter subunit IIC n=1 Tax=Streptococcus chenjunshii TaxID=2173853 RepID=A0A372KME0_9STRE|nr:PTS glucitol/sorbitol transporter subunit IIC [Streptococcus chenjunshii]AXQ79635.1 PTS sorbitol transporter subunit IIC [Streptococcus chenjunshii]RFU51050.1 PTS sorbitol transporter subunit IIC [Streptococcus chenjunshii]RFU53094.1 PTS sorbitol transporter subunit IIC [Streptococcus chenjunshii]